MPVSQVLRNQNVGFHVKFMGAMQNRINELRTRLDDPTISDRESTEAAVALLLAEKRKRQGGGEA
jgi:hypothetical protein